MTALRNAARLVATAALSIGASAAGGQAQDAPHPAVTVVVVEPQDMTLTTTLPGRAQSLAEAEVRPQVDGIVTERRFREGAEVAEGDVLYTIDPATYEAAVAQAEAAVAKAQAELDVTGREADRIEELSSRNVASEQNRDAATSARDVAAAGLQVAQARLQAARIELDRTTIRARLSGEIGLSQTSPGALVTASQAKPMAVIHAIDPVYVDVTQSAADLLAWRGGSAEETLGVTDCAVAVTLTLADGTEYDQTGKLTAAEPHVDEQTGVVTLRMEFANPDKLLLPGMYVQVEMPTRTARDVILAPQEGVGRDRRGRPTALVVNDENVVESRELTVLQDRGSDWIVGAGLEAGDRMIVEGLQRAAPGAAVAPELREPALAPEKGAAGAAEAPGEPPLETATTEPVAGLPAVEAN